MTPVTPRHRGLREGLHRKIVKRAITSETAGVLAFEASDNLGGGLIDPPAGRLPDRHLRGRLPARCRPTSTRLVTLLIRQLDRAPFDGHLPPQVEDFVLLVFPNPFHVEFTLDHEP